MRAFLLFLTAAPFAAAASITSTGAGGNWSAASTWVGGVVPGPGDDAVLAGPVTVPAGATVTAGKSLPQTPTYQTFFPSTVKYAPTIQAAGDGAGCGAATGGSLQSGSYYARFTWVNANGESGPSAESAQFTVASGNIPCVVVPALPAGVTGWNLYVTPGARWSETLYAEGITATKYAMSAAQSAGATYPAWGAGGIRIASGGALTIDGTLILRGDLAQSANGANVTIGPGGVLEFDASRAADPSTTGYQWMPSTAYGLNPTITINGSSFGRATVRSNAAGGNAAILPAWDDRTAYPGTHGSWSFAYADFLRIGSDKWYGFLAASFGGGITAQHCVFDATQELHSYTGIANTANLDLHNNSWKNSLPTGSTAISSIVVTQGTASWMPNPANITVSGTWPVMTSEAKQLAITGVTGEPALNGVWSAAAGATQNSASSYTLNGGFAAVGTYNNAGMTLTAYGNNIELQAATPTSGKRILTGNVFDRWVTFPGNGTTVEDNIFMVGARAYSTPTASFQRNLFRRIDGGAGSVWGDTYENYIMTDDVRQGNPHPMYDYSIAAHYAYNIFEYTADTPIYDGGDISVSTAAGASLYFDHNIVLPLNTLAAESYNCINVTTTSHVYFEHNTCFNIGAFINEAGAPHIDTLKNNLIWRTTAPAPASSCLNAGGAALIDVHCLTPAVNAVDLADYNGFWNPQTTAAPGATSARYQASLTAPGQHDVIGDPQFVDYTRNFGNWAASLGCTGSTYQAKVACGLAQLQLQNEDAYDPRFSIPNAMAWIRAGLTPRNSAFIRTADDGGTLGAVAGQAVGMFPLPSGFRRR